VGSFIPELVVDRAAPSAPPTRLVTASVALRVSEIECSNGKMNENLRKAVDAQANRDIRFESTGAKLVDPGCRVPPPIKPVAPVREFRPGDPCAAPPKIHLFPVAEARRPSLTEISSQGGHLCTGKRAGWWAQRP